MVPVTWPYMSCTYSLTSTPFVGPSFLVAEGHSLSTLLLRSIVLAPDGFLVTNCTESEASNLDVSFASTGGTVSNISSPSVADSRCYTQRRLGAAETVKPWLDQTAWSQTVKQTLFVRFLLLLLPVLVQVGIQWVTSKLLVFHAPLSNINGGCH